MVVHFAANCFIAAQTQYFESSFFLSYILNIINHPQNKK